MFFTAISVLFFTNLTFGGSTNESGFQRQQSGWFASQGESCRDVCFEQRRSHPETAQFIHAITNNYASYTCKAKVTTRFGEGELIGNNFTTDENESFCLIAPPDSQITRRNEFSCLCNL